MELWRPHLKKNLNITASTKQRQIISNYAVAGFFLEFWCSFLFQWAMPDVVVAKRQKYNRSTDSRIHEHCISSSKKMLDYKIGEKTDWFWKINTSCFTSKACFTTYILLTLEPAVIFWLKGRIYGIKKKVLTFSKSYRQYIVNGWQWWQTWVKPIGPCILDLCVWQNFLNSLTKSET